MNLETDQELAIWNQTFATAFANEFQKNLTLFQHHGNPKDGYPFDRAMEAVTAENAGHIANHSVKEYRRWMENEG